MKSAGISVIIPVRSINPYLIEENFPALDAQTYKDFEVIVLPNNSSSHDAELQQKYPWLRIVPTGKITRPAQKRNVGANEAMGKIVAFIDDDAYPSPSWLYTAEEIFSKNKVEAVCGPGVLPKKTNNWEQAFDLLLKSPFGSGGFSYRFTPEKARFVDDYPSMNLLIDKKVFLDLGGFDNDYWPGEDSKLCEDLVYKKNGKILYHPEVLIYHHRRDSLIGFLKQHSQYGYHRGAFFAHGDNNSRRLSYLIPTLFVVYVFTFGLLNIFLDPQLLIELNPILSLPLKMYALILVLQTVAFTFETKDVLLSALAILTLFLTHMTYGVFFIKGFFMGLFKKDQIY